MIKLSSLKLDIDKGVEELKKLVSTKLSVSNAQIKELIIKKRSLEARKKEELKYVYTVLVSVENEGKVKSFLRSKKGADITKKHGASFIEKEEKYIFPYDCKDTGKKVVIAGSGPAGLLCAYELAKAGMKPLVIERGSCVEERIKKVNSYWEGKPLDKNCNVQFGEGGAGTFSDGKLNTGVNDKNHRHQEVFDLFVECGADSSILYDAMPHVGTDVLAVMVANIRNKIIKLGGEFKFDTCVTDINVSDNRLESVVLNGNEVIKADACVFAIGHSARDTFKMLYDKGIEFAPKAFAVGVRAEHDQNMINVNQWGEGYPKSLGSAAYKLTHRTKKDRAVYTFCMCPGGFVVNASSEDEMIAVNGMSYSKRDSGRANSAVIVSVEPSDYVDKYDELPRELRGIAFQRDLEHKAFVSGSGKVPVQRYGDFKAGIKGSTEIACAHKGLIENANLNEVLPDFIAQSLIEGIEVFDKKIKGYASDDTVLYAVESRTSSPVRIQRDDTFQCNIEGIYPCGEGAGYAGGITSAAIDGIKTAEAVAYNLNK